MTRKKVNGKSQEMYREDEASKHNAHILWLQEQLCSPHEFDSKTHFCESEGTVSSSSWGFDDFELKSVKKITSSLNTIESILYDGETASSLSEELNSECCKWAKAFPHLRVKGQQITVEGKDSAALGSQNDKYDKSFQRGMPSLVHDGILAGDEATDYISGSPVFFNNDESCETMKAEKYVPHSYTSAYIKQRVIEKVAMHIWQNVISGLKGSKDLDTFDPRQEGRLPPILNVNSSFQHLRANIKSPLSYDYQKLEGILTVSPKILLPRDEAKLISDVRQNSSKPGTASTRIPLHAKISQVRKALRQPHDAEPFLLQLIEEDSYSCNGLLGTHIELQGKDLKHRFSPFHVPVVPRPPSFLPPIDDTERSPSSVAQDFYVPPLYESRIRSGSSFKQPSVYTRHLNRMSSRPSTSRLNSGKKDSELKPTDSTGGIAVTKKEKPGCGVNLVNLFPVVTSKELTEKRKTCTK